jgi:ankyrin repeat protein
MTPLAVAARYNKLEALNWLLAQPEVDVNARDTHGLTALHHAVLGNTAACTKALLAAGINAGLKDNVGYTPEQLAKMRAKDKNERKRVGADVVEAFKGVKTSGSP